MKKLYIVANWKANMTESEASVWLDAFSKGIIPFRSKLEEKEIIVCPPFTLLSFLNAEIRRRDMPLQLGTQDVSMFGRGAYTGEIAAALLHDYASFVIVGHSERRKNFLETNDTISTKVASARSAMLLPIVCVDAPTEKIPSQSILVAYEPVSAIGTGRPDTPEDASHVAREIKEKNKEVQYVLYGGSVDANNVASFTRMESIDGVLVGKASLDADEFSAIIRNA